jgi:hypothetical protein
MIISKVEIKAEVVVFFPLMRSDLMWVLLWVFDDFSSNSRSKRYLSCL